MKPRKISVESEREERQKSLCDTIISRAAHMMVDELKAPIPMMLDRLLTYAAAQACAVDGSPKTAAAFRQFAANIEGGLFHSITGESRDRKREH